jgi:hypothetical protein
MSTWSSVISHLSAPVPNERTRFESLVLRSSLIFNPPLFEILGFIRLFSKDLWSLGGLFFPCPAFNLYGDALADEDPVFSKGSVRRETLSHESDHHLVGLSPIRRKGRRET